MDWHDRFASEEEREMYEMVNRWCADRVDPRWFQLECEGQFPEKIVGEMAELGLMGLSIPEEYGGVGAGAATSALIARRISYASPGLYLILTANTSLAAFPILYAGSEEEKMRRLPYLADGSILGCFALTEPDAGSDVGRMRTRAKKEDGQWVINGAKRFSTNAAHARLCVLFARTGDKPHDISAFVLSAPEAPLAIQGVSVSKMEKWGQRISDMCEIYFDDVLLPESALLGEENGGFKIAMETLNRGRLNIAAQALGGVAWILDYVWDYLQERSTFGQPIAENQYPQFQFAEWSAELRNLWSVVRAAAEKADEGILLPQEAAGVKLHVTEAACRIAMPAAHYMGGNLFAKECPVMSRFIDILITPVYEGASNIQRMVLSKTLQ